MPGSCVTSGATTVATSGWPWARSQAASFARGESGPLGALRAAATAMPMTDSENEIVRPRVMY